MYEYMSNGSLADLLFTPEKQPNWVERMGIGLDVARGILYLHEECETQNVDWSISEEEAILKESVYNCFESGEVCKLVGDEEVDKRQLDRMVKVGLWCILDEPSLRPSMKKVLLMLEGTVDIPVPPSPVSFLFAIV